MGKIDKTVQQYKDKINDMLLDEDYGWAEGTLKGMLKVIEGHNFITLGQQTAIDNILKSKPNSETYKEWM